MMIYIDLPIKTGAFSMATLNHQRVTVIQGGAPQLEVGL